MTVLVQASSLLPHQRETLRLEQEKEAQEKLVSDYLEIEHERRARWTAEGAVEKPHDYEDELALGLAASMESQPVYTSDAEYQAIAAVKNLVALGYSSERIESILSKALL